MEERRDALQALALGRRIAQLAKQGHLLRLPPRGRALQRADPVRHPEDVDADVEHFGLERQRRGHHVAAVAAADDADPRAVHPVLGLEPGARPHAVLQVDLAVLLVVHVEEGLAVAGRAPVVHAEDDVALVHQVLDVGPVGAPRLAARPAVHPDHRRRRVVGRCPVRPPQDGRDLQAVEARVADDLGGHEVVRVDLGVQALRQAQGLAALFQVVDVQVGRRAVAAHVEGHQPVAGREADARDVARRQIGQFDRRAGLRVRHLDDRRSVLVDRRHAVAAGLGEGDAQDVPVGGEHELAGARSEIVGPHLVELAVLARPVVEPRAVRREAAGAVLDLALVLGDVDQATRRQVVGVHVAVVVAVQLVERHPAAVVADGAQVERAVVLEDELALEVPGSRRRHLVTVEVHGEGRALVRPHEERPAVGPPAGEGGAHVAARRQVDRTLRDLAFAVRPDVQVVQLVAALVAGVEEAVVVREPALREHRTRAVGQLHRLAAGHRHAVDGPNAGHVAGDQQPALVGRERRAAVGGRVVEGSRAVDGRLARLGLLGGAAAEDQRGQHRNGTHRETRPRAAATGTGGSRDRAVLHA